MPRRSSFGPSWGRPWRRQKRWRWRWRDEWHACSSPCHVVIFFELPALAAVVGLLALPVERLRGDLQERPTKRQAVGVGAVQDDAVSFPPPLRVDEIVEPRIDKHDPPLLRLRIEKPQRRPDAALLPRLGRIPDPQVLH